MAIRTNHILRALFIVLAVVLFVPVLAQNTKGDRPKENRGTIRRTEGKTVKKKSKASTRDIAGRRLRTKNKSSANRANVGIPQPLDTRRQPRRPKDHAARVSINKGYASQERRRSDPDRSWKGDISGYKSRRIKPSNSDANHANVYPQGKYASRHPQPKQRPFKGYENKTASGKTIVKRSPKRSERAWKGDIHGKPFFPPSSQTGRFGNVHSQKTRYSKYVSKRPSAKDRSFNNRDNVAKARAMGTDTSPKNWKRGTPIGSYGQAPYVTRGRKNVYWGKIRVGGKAITKDPAGRPLSRRNFRSGGMGLTGTDTLAFFGRRPHDDATFAKKRKGKFLPGSEAKGGWLNDIAGYRLRKRAAGGGALMGAHGKGYRTSSGFRSNAPIEGKAPGIGAGAIERDLKKTGGAAKRFGDLGGAYSGSLKSKRRGKFTGARAALWNNNGSPIGPKGLSSNGIAAARFTGRSSGGKNFGDQGGGYSGAIKRKKLYADNEFAYRGFLKGGKREGKFIGGTRGLWNNKTTPIIGKGASASGLSAGQFSGRIRGGGKNFRDQGGAYSGSIKERKGFNDQGGGYSGSIKERKRFNDQGGGYTGDIKANKRYNEQGGGYTGALKRRKLYPDEELAYRGFLKGGKQQGGFIGSVARNGWNNRGQAVTEVGATRSGALAGNFQGRSRPKATGKSVASLRGLWNNNNRAVTELEATRWAGVAGNFQGHSRPKATGKSVAALRGLWNNNNKAVTEIEATRAGALAGNFQGRSKAREPRESKIMKTPNVLWNNKGKAITEIEATKGGASAGLYQGRSKAKKHETYPLSTERQRLWSNGGKATTQIMLTNSGAAAGAFSGNTKYKKESKHRDAGIEDKMRVKKFYVENPHSAEEALKKEKPHLNYKAGNFASGAKINGRRSHSPNSVDDALDSYHNRASARRVDYQGNVKMRKFIDHRESPDAKFVHNGENNVKDDRTIMTNVKLLWAKLFQKSESQPSNLKERSNKLRYDKGEKGMWAD